MFCGLNKILCTISRFGTLRFVSMERNRYHVEVENDGFIFEDLVSTFIIMLELEHQRAIFNLKSYDQYPGIKLSKPRHQDLNFTV